MGLTRNARVSDARRLCPGIVIVEARPEVYIKLSPPGSRP